MPTFMDPQDSDEAFIEVTNLNIPSMKLLLKKESLGTERQISVDPISLQKESNEQASPAYTHDDFTPKKLWSISMPNSTISTPEFGAEKNNYYSKNQISPLERQHSAVPTNLEHLKEINLQRSKSCGEGRASTPPEEFDLWFANNNGSSSVKPHDAREMSNSNNTSSFSFHEDSSEGGRMDGTCTNNRSSVHLEEKFKCGALCLFIPGRLGKGKPVRSARRRQESGISTSSDQMGHHHVVSRTVSLERFECGSWTSSAIIHEEGDASNNLFFDLPLELIRCNANDDTHSPVTTAFVFDKEVKGVLKNTTTKTDPSRKSHESARHVRFSTSSPTSYPTSPTSACVTPRLRKAREDFTTFLEAQSA